MLHPNYLREKLGSGQPVLGTFAVIPSPAVVDVLGTTGIDFVVIDGEHGPIGFETAQQMVVAAESRGISPVMRVSGVNEAEILKALDIGVHCVQVPNVATRDAVEQVVHHAKFPPQGNRGFSPFMRAAGYTHHNSAGFGRAADENTLLAIHVEGQEALTGIDNILGVDALDIVFLGRYDISKSLGIPGQVDDPRVVGIVHDLATRIERAGKVAGTILTQEDQLTTLLAMGIRYLTFSVDCEMIRRAYEGVSSTFHELRDRRQ